MVHRFRILCANGRFVTMHRYFCLKSDYFLLNFLVESFFMKTCTFHHSKPRSIEEGLFCINVPEARYGMKQCRDINCRFCYERLDLTHRLECAMHFSNNQLHHFVNHYQVYLNCHVVS